MHFVLWKRSSFKCWRWKNWHWKSFVTLNNMLYTKILAFYGSKKKSGKILLSKVSRVKISSFRWEMSMSLLFVSNIVKMTWILWFSKTLDMLYISSVEHIRWTACDVANNNNISEKMYESIITIRIYLLSLTLFCLVLIWFLISISILSPRELPKT